MPKFGGDRTQANEIRNAAFTSRWNANTSSSSYCACSLSSPPGSHRACRTTPLRYLSTDERGPVPTVAIAGAQMCCLGRSRNQRLDACDRIKLIPAAYFRWEARLSTKMRRSPVPLSTTASTKSCRSSDPLTCPAKPRQRLGVGSVFVPQLSALYGPCSNGYGPGPWFLRLQFTTLRRCS